MGIKSGYGQRQTSYKVDKVSIPPTSPGPYASTESRTMMYHVEVRLSPVVAWGLHVASKSQPRVQITEAARSTSSRKPSPPSYTPPSFASSCVLSPNLEAPSAMPEDPLSRKLIANKRLQENRRREQRAAEPSSSAGPHPLQNQFYTCDKCDGSVGVVGEGAFWAHYLDKHAGELPKDSPQRESFRRRKLQECQMKGEERYDFCPS